MPEGIFGSIKYNGLVFAGMHWLKLISLAFLPLVLFAFAPDQSTGDSKSAGPKKGDIKRWVAAQSVMGRSIYAYSMGNGPRKILLLGGKHGDEINSVRTVYYIMNRLYQERQKLPRNITVFFVPLLNPDGFVYMSRVNANGTDINRNFPTKNWRQRSQVSGYSLPNGGGAEPKSEPETRFLIDFLLKHRPVLSLTYHSRAGYIYPEVKDPFSVRLAKRYSKASGIKAMIVSWSQNYYTVTGSFGQWMDKQKGMHTILIEHKKKYHISDMELEANWRGFWSMVRHLSKKAKP